MPSQSFDTIFSLFPTPIVMWGWLSYDKPTSRQPLLISKTVAVAVANDDDDDHHHHYRHHPTATIAMILTTWVRGRRIRYVFVALCSPLLVPLLCVTFPILCAVEICSRICRRRRDRKMNYDDGEFDCHDMRRCEEGGGCGGGGGGEAREMRLLQRYLEDQLVLVLESVYECGELGFHDWDYDDGGGEFLDTSCRNTLCPD